MLGVVSAVGTDLGHGAPWDVRHGNRTHRRGGHGKRPHRTDAPAGAPSWFHVEQPLGLRPEGPPNLRQSTCRPAPEHRTGGPSAPLSGKTRAVPSPPTHLGVPSGSRTAFRSACPARDSVSRRCRAGRGRWTRREPVLQVGAPGPTTFSSDDGALADLRLEPAQDRGGSSRSWVAQAVESARTTRTPSSKRHRRAVRRHVRPDDLRPSGPSPPPTATSTFQPRSSSSRSIWSPSSGGRGRRGRRC